MTIHHEGYRTIGIASLLFGLINILSFAFLSSHFSWLSIAIFIITFFLLLFIISFFRVPERTLTIQENAIVCPADGKIVVIEDIIETEYFKDKRTQISIFMSPTNVHINRNPMSGEVVYNQYHKGKYLVAWHPKSSTENERWSVVVSNAYGKILYKQIAGALARRICNYTKPGDKVQQSAEYGFIKFGSRVDVIIPTFMNVKVELNQQVKGGVTVLATWPYNIQ
ncbi:phosphatidylserine decarboxylase family protein [Hydrotalea sp.]|uniref:phosphatidylserine decarboxylase family protein n=1 Tax=Hydrotalea sp. TaxID=2881279 RepID=UPI00261DCA80|nr:phosphatidylserine decarboxylase family protein [Hydrotalea sp.]